MGGPGSGRRSAIVIDKPAATSQEELYRRVMHAVVFTPTGIGAIIQSHQEPCEIQYSTYAIADMKKASVGDIVKVSVVRYEPGTEDLLGCIKTMSGSVVRVISGEARSLCLIKLMDDVKYEHTMEVYNPAEHAPVKPMDDIYLIEHSPIEMGFHTIQKTVVSWVNLPGRPGIWVGATGPEPRLMVVPRRSIVLAGIWPYWPHNILRGLMAGHELG